MALHRGLAAALGLAAAALAAPATAATIAYNIVDLGTLGSFSALRSYGQAVNDYGQVVGSSNFGTTKSLGTHAFLWANGSMQDLGVLATGNQAIAYGINNKTQVTGYSTVSGGAQHAFLWQNGTLTDLGTNGGVHAQGRDINDDGKIAGFRIITGNAPIAWTNDGSFDSLPAVGTGKASNAFRINSSGVVAGDAYNSQVYGVRRAVTWDASGVVTNLHIGSEGTDSIAYGLNDGGDVVGRYLAINGNNDTISRAFWWHKATGTWQTLGQLAGEVNYYAYSISNDGKIVGVADHANANGNQFISSGVMWQNGVATRLNDLIDPLLGWNIIFGQDISQNGYYITGQGQVGGKVHAFLMCAIGQPCNGVIPGIEPPPPSPPPVGGVPEPDEWEMLLAGFGLLGLVARRRQRTRPC